MNNKNQTNNNILIEQFELLVDQIKSDINFSNGKNQLVNMFRLSAIQKVLNILKEIKFKITSSDQLKGIKNIGNRSLKKIDEILKTGKLSEIKITKKSKSHLKIITELEKVFGIGRKTAYELFKKYDVKSISDLKSKYENNEIELPENIVKGLKYVDVIKTDIPRNEIDKMKNILFDAANKISPFLFGTVCGSYRREKSTSGDIDFILVHTKINTKEDALKCTYLKKFVQLLKKNGIIVDSLTSDNVPTKYMGLCKIGKGDICRLDIRYIQYESYYSAILYFTGSMDFNRKMRQVAIGLGYILNEYGLFDKNNKMFKVNSERDIFVLLGMEYLIPSLR